MKTEAALKYLYVVLKVTHQTVIETNSVCELINRDSLVFGVYHQTFLTGKWHSGKAIDVFADPEKVARVTAGNHQIGRHKNAGVAFIYGFFNSFIALGVGRGGS